MLARPLALLAATAAVAVLPTAAADAKKVKYTSYKVLVEGEADYDKLGKGETIRDAQARFTWKTQFAHVMFQDDRAYTESPDNLEATTTAVLEHASATATTPHDTYACTADGLSFPASSGRFFDTPHVPGTDPVIKLRLLGGLFPDFDACNHQAMTQFSLNGAIVDGRHTYETEFTFPREAIGMGKVIQLVEEEVTDRRCPGNHVGEAKSCRLSLKATVTFEKTNEFVLDDSDPGEITEDDLPELPGPPAPPAPPADPAPAELTPADVPLPPVKRDELTTKAGKLAPDAGSASVTVLCAGGCAGEVVARPLAGSKARGAAAARVLARKRFTAKAGRVMRVTLRFRPTARRAIRRAGGVRLAVTAGDDRRTVTLRR